MGNSYDPISRHLYHSLDVTFFEDTLFYGTHSPLQVSDSSPSTEDTSPLVVQFPFLTLWFPSLLLHQPRLLILPCKCILIALGLLWHQVQVCSLLLWFLHSLHPPHVILLVFAKPFPGLVGFAVLITLSPSISLILVFQILITPLLGRWILSLFLGQCLRLFRILSGLLPCKQRWMHYKLIRHESLFPCLLVRKQWGVNGSLL